MKSNLNLALQCSSANLESHHCSAKCSDHGHPVTVEAELPLLQLSGLALEHEDELAGATPGHDGRVAGPQLCQKRTVRFKLSEES